MHPFWSQVADQYEQVIVVPGNHEFYKYYDIASLQEGELVQIRSNVKVYYNAIVNMGEVDMILSTLWAHIPLQDAFATESGVTDYWIYGHSHRNIDKLIGKTQCVSNQLGTVFYYIAKAKFT